ncbi:MAG TPA: M48 family metallopeptidase [Acidimicrobiales bacterium]|nr:M48 family metallopeptidase [Acidimicrobiales bacterium]
MESLWSGSIEGWSEPVAAPRQRRRTLIAEAADRAVASAAPPPLPVEVVRSAKRRKSVAARIVDGRIVVRVPQWMSKAQEAEHVAALVAKLERQRTSTIVDLPSRARLLSRRYDLPEPASIRWVSNQRSRWGSCTPAHGEIRISDRIAGFPDWVVDAVIVHELAHLVHLDHSPAFWELAHRYPRTERALGFLIAKQLTDDDICQP